MISIRESIDLMEADDTPAQQFLVALWKISAPHPFDRYSRIINGNATVEVRPDVDDRDTTIHISDIMSLDAGKRLGYGRDALLVLLKLADQYAVTLSLTAKAYAKGPGSKNFPKTSALVAWYSHYGFIRKAGDMRRKPHTPIPAPRADDVGKA